MPASICKARIPQQCPDHKYRQHQIRAGPVPNIDETFGQATDQKFWPNSTSPDSNRSAPVLCQISPKPLAKLPSKSFGQTFQKTAEAKQRAQVHREISRDSSTSGVHAQVLYSTRFEAPRSMSARTVLNGTVQH